MPGAGFLKSARTDAAGQLKLARNSSSYSCKFTAIFDLLDNSTSPGVEAHKVTIDMKKP